MCIRDSTCIPGGVTVGDAGLLLCKHKVHKLHRRCILKNEDVPWVEFTYHIFTRMRGEVTVGDSGLLLCPLSLEC